MLAQPSLLGCCFRQWAELLAEHGRRLECRRLLENLREVGLEWLMAALGEVLPSLLPDQSMLTKVGDWS